MNFINLEFLTKSFITFFVIIGPIDLMVIFTALTRKDSARDQKIIAFKANLVAFFILVAFTFLGSTILSSIGISIPALKASGGLLLMIVAYKMVFESDSHSSDYGDDEKMEAKTASDVYVFPLATPLIAGGGAMSVTILLSAGSEGGDFKSILVVLAFSGVLVVNYILFTLASRVQKILGPTLINIITRVMGILLAALSVQFIIDALKSIT